MKKYLILATLPVLFSNLAFSNQTIEIEKIAIESYANQFNTSNQEAEKRLAIMSNADEIVHRINQDFGDSIASIFFDNGQNFRMVIRTSKKGNIQKQIENLASQISNDYGLKIEVIANHPRNFKSIQNIISNQRDRLLRQYDNFQLIGYNPEKDTIYLAFHESDPNKQKQIHQKFKKLSGMDTTIEFLNESIKPTKIIGGGGLEYSNIKQGACTAGFTGTMNGQAGFLTATHCVDDNVPTKYIDSLGRKYSLGKPTIDKSPSHEVSFLPTPNTIIANEVYRYLDGKGVNQSYRTNLKITGLGVIRSNDTYNGYHTGGLQLCHIGQRTGYSCGIVTQVNVGGGACNATLPGDDHRSCLPTFFLVEGNQHKVNQGDSGGPYFDSSGKAYGLASAMGGLNIAIVTPITYIVQSGFRLKTEN